MKPIASYAADGCYLAGVCLLGAGLYHISPALLWFYLAVVCWLLGVLLDASLRRTR